MRRASKVDKNHAEVVKALRQCGWSVLDLSRVGGGCPDLLLSMEWHPSRTGGLVRDPVTLLAEIKVGKATLNDAQRDFHRYWKGRIVILRSVQDALDLRP